jgi:putative methyltransferase (TIGR04325 family)
MPSSQRKQWARNWLPPGLIRLGRRMMAYIRPPEYEYLPNGWDGPDPRIQGWNVESIAETQRRRWPEYAESLRGSGPLAAAGGRADCIAHNVLMTYAYVLALTARKRDRISLLDWGGGAGQYNLLSRALLPDAQVDYYCKDVPVLCRLGRELQPDVTFFETDEACFSRVYDLVLSSGSLLYAEKWQNIVGQFAKAAASYLFITRMPIVHKAKSYVAVQRPYHYGYRTEYRGWFLNRQELLEQVCCHGMELVREFPLNERLLVHKAPEQGELRGFLFRPCCRSGIEQS